MDGDRIAAVSFGRKLAWARKSAGLTQDALAHLLGFSASHVSNLERGRRDPPIDRLPEIDAALGARGRLTEAWQRASGNDGHAWLYEFSDMVRDSASVSEYQILNFPGYLQTEAYARAIIRAGAPWLTPSEVSAQAAERARWADGVAGANAPIIWTVVDQTALWRRYGGIEVTGRQLSHVRDLIESDRITLQVVPADAVRHPGTGGTFTLLTSDAGDVVYTESIRFGQFVTADDEVAKYRMLFGALQGSALDPDESLLTLQNEIMRLRNA